jgi:hypothetical protein
VVKAAKLQSELARKKLALTRPVQEGQKKTQVAAAKAVPTQNASAKKNPVVARPLDHQQKKPQEAEAKTIRAQEVLAKKQVVDRPREDGQKRQTAGILKSKMQLALAEHAKATDGLAGGKHVTFQLPEEVPKQMQESQRKQESAHQKRLQMAQGKKEAAEQRTKRIDKAVADVKKNRPDDHNPFMCPIARKKAIDKCNNKFWLAPERHPENRESWARGLKVRPTLELTGPSPIPTCPPRKVMFPLKEIYYPPKNSTEDWHYFQGDCPRWQAGQQMPLDHPLLLKATRNYADQDPEAFNKYMEDMKAEDFEGYLTLWTKMGGSLSTNFEDYGL